MASKQLLFCRACGKKMLTTFNWCGGEVCSRRCGQELEWRRVLSILGEEYHPDPTPFLCVCGNIAAEGEYCVKCIKLIAKANEEKENQWIPSAAGRRALRASGITITGSTRRASKKKGGKRGGSKC